jgi:hypothetical protein
MNPASRRKAGRIGRQASELMAAAPQVVAHRLARMAASGHRPSAQDRREFHRMGAEKLAAFGEAWQAMALQTLKSQQQLSTSLLRSWSLALSGRREPALPLATAAAQLQQATLDIMSQGMRPVHRRAVANVRRLGRTRRR